MADDQHVQSLIEEAQEAASKPMTFKDRNPMSERWFGQLAG
ncbi:MAG TPA: hypothetical protein VK901_16910 [Nitrospiraceae bacterium]|nr:hypothetical protein [Nitrospiraceae bacterium]